MKKQPYFKKENLSKELLLESVLELENIMVTLDKTHSGFDDNDLDKIALSTLLFFSEKRILDRLHQLRMKLYLKLEKLIGKKKLSSRLERIKQVTPEYYEVKNNLTEEEMKEEILKYIVLYMYTLTDDD